MTSFKKWLTVVCMTGLVCVAPTASAAYATDANAMFVAHFEHNAQIEAELLQEAESTGGVGASPNVLAGIVGALNNQISSLYTVEQALSAVAAGVPVADRLQAWRSSLLHERNALKSAVRRQQGVIHRGAGRHVDSKSKSKWLVQQRANLREDMLKLQSIESELKLTQPYGKNNPSDPSSGGLAMLQQAIFHLQETVIRYTDEWLTQEQPSWAALMPTSISGLAYAQTSIVPPASGSPPFTDEVIAQPTVKDAKGQPLPNIGGYTLVGPLGMTGVSLDPVTGTVTVRSNATAGSYTVRYTQGDLSENSLIEIS